MSTPNDASRALGSLFGVAFGDAMGLPTEFLTFEQIKERWPPSGPMDLVGQPARVTDDTQMTIAVGGALLHVLKAGSFTPVHVERALRNRFVEWLHSPDNNRALGRTCMTACARLGDGASWLDATVVRSKGCGANMRVAPAAFVPANVRAPIAQFQAALTHGHPTALAASDLTAYAIASLAEGTSPTSLISALRHYAESQRTTYHLEWLGDLWLRAGASDQQSYISAGWDECLGVLASVDRAVPRLGDEADPCTATGEGWVAEEAFATGLLCFLLHQGQPRRAVCRGAATGGDSDSIASIAGALAGACLGISSWPQTWIDRIEYGEQIGPIARDLAAMTDLRS